MITGAIFDLDGTLVDSNGYWDLAPEAYLRACGKNPGPGIGQKIFAMTVPDAADYLRREYGIDQSPAEIVKGVVSRKDGTSVDWEFRSGAEKAMEIVRNNRVEVVILQSRSPSCGVNAIYDGSFSGKLIPGQGVFTELLQKNGIKVIDVEDL